MQEVVVIDDTEEVRSVIITTLAHFGFQAQGAKDGEAGIQAALESRPHLIICDVRMPGLDGYQTLAKVRELPAIANTPFIFLTAAMEKDDVRRGMVLGADDYLTKPFTPEELLDAVAMRLARQSELKSEVLLRAEKLQGNVAHLLSQELVGPLENIMALTATMMREYTRLGPEKIFVNAREINECVQRLSRLAKSLD